MTGDGACAFARACRSRHSGSFHRERTAGADKPSRRLGGRSDSENSLSGVSTNTGFTTRTAGVNPPCSGGEHEMGVLPSSGAGVGAEKKKKKKAKSTKSGSEEAMRPADADGDGSSNAAAS